MIDQVHVTLSSWANFYLITGTAAAALTGLQFIVQTLLASNALSAVGGDDPEGGIAAFGTPTVVHFSLSLVISAVMCAPWSAYGGLRLALGVLGMGALAYSAIVLRRARKQDSYAPTAYDWTSHVVLPATANTGILAAALFLRVGSTWPLVVTALATLLLLCVGIHNAWDTVTYLTIAAIRRQNK
ncbi:MAG: hypothetical protein JWO05_890 [Gemmatimonadetes bacterium]|nr:hypothetical protein [Gemmatimonadota bacterium]